MSVNGMNVRPGGGYQSPVLPRAIRNGGSSVNPSINPENWDEVLRHLQFVMEENANLNKVLSENNERVEKIIEKKNEEISIAHKNFWDVRISVLGVKTKNMSLEGEVQRLKSTAGTETSTEIDELKKKIRNLESGIISYPSATDMNKELIRTKEQLSNFQAEISRLSTENSQLQNQLKSRTPPQPKPRTNIHARIDAKLTQAEKERDEAKTDVIKYREAANQERISRETLEQKFASLSGELEDKKRMLESRTRELSLVKKELDDKERALQQKNRSVTDEFNYSRAQFEHQKQVLDAKIKQLERENSELRSRSVGSEPSLPQAAAGGGYAVGKVRRMLNTVTQENNQLKERIAQLEMEVVENQKDSERVRALTSEVTILRDQLRNYEMEMHQLQEEKEDMKHQLEQKIITLNEELIQKKTQVEGLHEKYHVMQVDYSKALSQIRLHKQELNAGDRELGQIENEIENLMNDVEQKDNEITTLQSKLDKLRLNYDAEKKERDRLMEKLQSKQKDCDDYLNQMAAWRAQYETAQNDFAQERTVREKEALAFKVLKENRDKLQNEVGELRKRVTDQQAIIASIETASPSGFRLGTYTQEFMTTPPNSRGMSGSSVGTVPEMGPGMGGVNPGVGGGNPGMGGGNPGMGGGNPGMGGVGSTSPQFARYTNAQALSRHNPGFVDSPNIPMSGLDAPIDVRRKHSYEYSQQPPASSMATPQIPDPRLGGDFNEPLNQLDNPPAIPPSPGSRPSYQAPVNAFPQFIGEKPNDRYDLPGEVQKMEPPAMNTCPICGRGGFKTQTDLEVHAAKCG